MASLSLRSIEREKRSHSTRGKDNDDDDEEEETLTKRKEKSDAPDRCLLCIQSLWPEVAVYSLLEGLAHSCVSILFSFTLVGTLLAHPSTT